MTNRDLFSAPAALAYLGLSTAAVAKAISVPIETLEAELELGCVLSKEEGRRLRIFLWDRGVVMVGTPLFDAAFYLTPLAVVRHWKLWAEVSAGRWGEGWGFYVFSRAWRFWLRATGQGHRIQKPANDVRPMDDGAAE
jgi:hypothetical protein